MQVVSTIAERQCKKSPLRVQQFIGQASTKDPLFRADKIMRAAQPLVADEDLDKSCRIPAAYLKVSKLENTSPYFTTLFLCRNPFFNVEIRSEIHRIKWSV